ncbi:hypothetical protein LV457_16755 [Mycobacterium sp. MYCO198283]|uniref:hypothetical protein n=1 Tax=Mycobacterium sp. MYCO198283 TaxID=2883505 RepID=UPI001E3F9F9C|nr:hypothetical protein [Mycobacterium sp. MYCO198283]MCG5433928.1 hypothetical protein [Mycobacterium sp. MYCO198283]
MMPNIAQLDALVAHCEELTDAKAPGGYPNSLALCVVDAVQSTGVRYTSVQNVVRRYREHREREHADADTDGVGDLLKTFADVGGPEQWAKAIGNRNRTSSHTTSPLKAAAIEAAAHALHDNGFDTTQQFRAAAKQPGGLTDAAAAWWRVPGQSSGVTWHYVQMLAGVDGVKPDRMVRRFVARALELPSVDADLAVEAVSQAANRLDMTATDLDYGIWRSERRRQ